MPDPDGMTTGPAVDDPAAFPQLKRPKVDQRYPIMLLKMKMLVNVAQKDADHFDVVVAVTEYMRNIFIKQPGTNVDALMDILTRLRVHDVPPTTQAAPSTTHEEYKDLPVGSQASTVHQLPPKALGGAAKAKRKVKTSQRSTGSNTKMSCKVCGEIGHDLRNRCKNLDALGHRLEQSSWSRLAEVPVFTTHPPPVQPVMPRAAKVVVVHERDTENTLFKCAYYQDVQLPPAGTICLHVDVLTRWCNVGASKTKFTLIPASSASSSTSSSAPSELFQAAESQRSELSAPTTSTGHVSSMTPPGQSVSESSSNELPMFSLCGASVQVPRGGGALWVFPGPCHGGHRSLPRGR